MHTPISWESLPPELWFTILEKLPTKSQVSLACTSKKIYQLSLDPFLGNLEQRTWIYLEAQKPLPDLLAKAITILRIPASQYEDEDIYEEEDVENQRSFILTEIKRMSKLRTLILEKDDKGLCFFPETTAFELIQQSNLNEFKIPGSFFTYKSPAGKTLLHVALEKRNKKLVNSLLSQMEVCFQQDGRKSTTNFSKELHACDAMGKTPLKIAMDQGNEELCLLLLRKGARGKEYLLSQENSDLSPIIEGTIEKGGHLHIESLSSTSFPVFFEAVKASRHLMTLGLSESFYQALKKEKLSQRARFFMELADALKSNSQGNGKILLLDLRACLGLTVQEIKPLFTCLGLEELWLPTPLLQHFDESHGNLLHLLLQESFPSMNKKVASSLIAQGVALTSKDHRGRTPRQLAQELGLKIDNNEMALFLEQAARDKLHKVAFGRKDWEKYFGKVGKEPPLPAQILDFLESPCPIWPDKKVVDTHLLTLLPEKVNGKPLTLNYLQDLVKNPKGGGNNTKYIYYHDVIQRDYGAIPSGASYWVLMTKDVLPNTRNKSYNNQLAELSSLAAKAFKTNGLGAYQTPKALEAASSIFMEYARSGNRFYSDSEGSNKRLTYTRCEETVYKGQGRVFIGGFAASGLSVLYDGGGNEFNGLGGARKCFGF